MNPVKYLIKDISNKPAPLDVWLQGTLEQVVVGNHVIISDSTGKAEITGMDFNDVVTGAHYCVLGVAVETSNEPKVKAVKFIKINREHQISWETEVKEAQLFLQGKVIPKI